MTSTDLVRQDSYARATLTEKREYVTAIAQAGELLPKSLWTNPKNVDGVMVPAAPSPAKVLMLAETGSMLGLHPMAALTGIHIIEGKPSLSANLLGALVRRAGHKLRITTSGSWADGTFVARAVLIRSDDPDFEFVVEWNPARAKQAGLLGKGNWGKYPEAMAKARATTEVIREGAPDVTMSAAYTPEELGAQVEGADGDVVELKQAPKAQAPIKESKPAAKPRAKSTIDKAKEDHAKVDAEAKARVKANQEARHAEAMAEPLVEPTDHQGQEEPVEANPDTGEVIEGGHSYDDAPHEDVVVPQEERSAYARAEASATSPDNIEDAQLVEEAEQIDWYTLCVEAADVDDAKKIWGDASRAGALDVVIPWRGESSTLRDVVTEIGQAFSRQKTEQE